MTILNALRSRHPGPCQPLSQVVQEWPTPLLISFEQPDEHRWQLEATDVIREELN